LRPRLSANNLSDVAGAITIASAITDDIVQIYSGVQHCLDLRHKYIAISLQRNGDNPKNNVNHWNIYPPPPSPRWVFNPDTNTWEDHKHDIPKIGVGEDFDFTKCQIPGPDRRVFKLETGVYQVYGDEKGTLKYGSHVTIDTEPITEVPTLREYYRDLDSIIAAASEGESKSFAYKRLQYLDGKWNLYILMNERQEMLDSKVYPFLMCLTCSVCLIAITTM